MLRAVIFDMDGVVSDTQMFHAEADSIVLKAFGIDMTSEELSEMYGGVPVRQIYTELFKKHKISPEEIPNLVEARWNTILSHSKGKIRQIKGSIELIDKLKADGFKIGLATGSIRAFAERVLTELNIKDRFDAISVNEDVKKGKPSPDIFILTAEKLEVYPDECIVIEDSKNGMIAAKKAGMKCIGLVSKEREAKGDYPADIIVNELAELMENEVWMI